MLFIEEAAGAGAGAIPPLGGPGGPGGGEGGETCSEVSFFNRFNKKFGHNYVKS